MTTATPEPRLSHRATDVLNIAHELARRDRTVEPHSGHLLVALLRAGGGVVEDTFQTLGRSDEDVLEAVLQADTASLTPPAPVTGGATGLQTTLQRASAIATDAGQVLIAAAHLLLAAVEAEDGVAAGALATLAVQRDELARIVWLGRDMLVPLLALPDAAPQLERAALAGVIIRRARVWDAPAVARLIAAERFSETWTTESAVAFSRQPVSLFVAERAGAIAGFAAYDCGRRGIFGPTGVARARRTGGVAAALLLRTLLDMRAIGYAYAIIGAVGPAEFYERVCGAILLPSAWPSYVTSVE